MSKQGVSSGVPFGQMVFGANQIAATNATRFLPFGYFTTTAPTNAVDFQVSVPFTVFRIDMLARLAGGMGQTMTGTIRKNGATTAGTIATASNATSGSQVLATPISFLPGDTIGFQVDKSGAGFATPTDLFFALGTR